MEKHKNLIGIQALNEQRSARPKRKAARTAARLLDRVLLFTRLNRYLSSFADSTPYAHFCDHIVTHLGLSITDFGDIEQHLPRSGPCIVVCNHPMGFPETFVVPQQLFKVRQDIKILANQYLSSLPYVLDHIIPIDVYATNTKIRQLKACSEWLSSGGVLLVFPSGEISDYCTNNKASRDSTWSDMPFKLARKHRASLVHVHLSGKNSPLFYFTSRICRALRVMWMSRELYNKRGKAYEVRASRPVNLNQFDGLKASQLTRYFYALNYALPLRDQLQASQVSATAEAPTHCPSAITLPDMAAASADLDGLSSQHVLCELKQYKVYHASAKELPRILPLIQHAREFTFRTAGMGTGQDQDSDRFDEVAQHLFIWDHGANALVGSYRYQVLSPGGHDSYLGSLYDADFPQLLAGGDFIECSRSFILPKYQKSFIGLLCLWRGLSQVILQNKRARYLSGVVSIPAGLLPVELQDVVARFVATNENKQAALSQCFHPDQPYQAKAPLPEALAEAVDCCDSIVQLENLFAQLSDGKYKLPVLFRQYESIGMHFIKMSVDPDFAGCLDLLGVWDIQQGVPEKLKTFMGDDGVEALRQRF